MKTDADLNQIIAESRRLALEWKHGFIGHDHLFAAMLRKKSVASKYVGHCNAEAWETKTKELYAQDSKLGPKDLLPLTVTAERLMKHSYKIASHINPKGDVNAIHVLLAILSFENSVTDTFKKAGITIEDITEPEFKKTYKPLPPIIGPLRNGPYNKVELFFFSSASKQTKATELHKNASDLFHYRQFEDSIKDCQAGLSLSPLDLNLKFLLTQNLIKQRNLGTALALAEDMAVNNPGNSSILFLLSYVNDLAGNYETADGILDKLLLKDPGNNAYLNNKGFGFIEQAKYQESVVIFDQIIQNDPAFAHAWSNLGFAKYKLGEPDIAIGNIDKSIELDKGNALAYRHRGIIYYKLGDKEQAIKNFNLALKFGYADQFGDEVSQLLAELTKQIG